MIGLLVVGALLGPLLAVVPSKRQRYLAAQRDYAAQLGLTVRMRPLPEIPPRFRFTPPHELMSYEQRLPEAEQGATALVCVNTPDGWQPLTAGQALPAGLELLPEGVALVTFSGHSVAAQWDESGDREAVDALATALGELQRPQ